MNTDILSDVARLSDPELLAQVRILAKREREATTALIAHLAIFDERRLYLGEGCSSMFGYSTQVLHFSEHAAYNRIETARAARKYPVILEFLAEGSLNLSTLRLLAPELTPANHRELLEAAKCKSKRQVEEFVARLRPRPSVPSFIRRLPDASRAHVLAAIPDAGIAATAPGPEISSQPAGDAPGLRLQPPTVPSRARPVLIAVLGPGRYRVQFTASAETHAKLRMAQDLLRHQVPDGDLGQIINRALTALLKEVAKQKFAATDRPNGHHSEGGRDVSSGSRHIPAVVKRAVWLRDGGRCAFVAPNGRRCTEPGFLEFHHVVPYSAGGEATVNNIQLQCLAHNGYEAELYFGPHAAPLQRQSRAVKESSAPDCTRPISTHDPDCG